MRHGGFKAIKSAIKSETGRKWRRNFFQFLPWLAISFVVWMFVYLSEQHKQSGELSLRLNSVPDSVTMITELPTSIKFTVNAGGGSWLKYRLNLIRTLTINFGDYSDGESVLRVSAADLRAEVGELFSSDESGVTVSPDSLRALFTSLPPKKVPVTADLDVSPNLQYVINGDTKLSDDSVMVYSDAATLASITQVRTVVIAEHDLTDTLCRNVQIAPVANAKVLPKTVTVTVPVEQLIAKRQNVDITVAGCPQGVGLLTFPAVAEASFLVPQSAYRENQEIRVGVSYSQAENSSSGFIPVSVTDAPAICKSLSLSLDSVEFLIVKY